MEQIQFTQLSIEEFEKIIENLLKKHLKETQGKCEEELLTREQVIKRLHISSSTLADYTKRDILKSYYIGSRVFYKWSEILNAGIKKVV